MRWSASEGYCSRPARLPNWSSLEKTHVLELPLRTLVPLHVNAMIVSSNSAALSGSSSYICASCVRHFRMLGLRPPGGTIQRRRITQNWLRKTAEAKAAWEAQAEEINAGRKQSMLSILEERGYVNAITGTREGLDRLMTEKRVGAYLGVDPTAPSLHVGHLVPLMTLFWMYVHGFHTVSLVSVAKVNCI